MEQLIINGDELTPVAIFHRLEGKRKVLLESRAEGKHGRYSIIAANPIETIRVDGNTLTDGSGTMQADDPLAVLSSLIERDTEDAPYPFIGGAVGYIGYDLLRTYEPIPNTRRTVSSSIPNRSGHRADGTCSSDSWRCVTQKDRGACPRSEY